MRNAFHTAMGNSRTGEKTPRLFYTYCCCIVAKKVISYYYSYIYTCLLLYFVLIQFTGVRLHLRNGRLCTAPTLSLTQKFCLLHCTTTSNCVFYGIIPEERYAD